MKKFELTVQQGKAFASSLEIAEVFGKRHDNIIQKIERLHFFDEYVSQLTFQVANYIDEQGKPRKYYLMDRTGFLMITLTLRGEKAEQFRLDYIKAFDKLENYYRNNEGYIQSLEQRIQTQSSLIKTLLPTDPYKTLSEVNDQPRTQQVKSYFRSKNGKTLSSKILKFIDNLQTSLFKNDKEFIEDVKQKLDKGEK